MNKLILAVMFSIIVMGLASSVSITSLHKSSSDVTILSTNITNFTNLLDVPNTYAGGSSKCVAVNLGETGLEFIDCSAGGGISSLIANNTYIKLTDLPLRNKTLPNWNNITNIPAGFADGVDDTGSGATYNSTYDGYNASYGKFWINQTYSGSTYNISYATCTPYAYNETQASNDSIVLTYDTKWSDTHNDTISNWISNLKISNITNFPSCSAGQFLTNISGLACDTPSFTELEPLFKQENATLWSTAKDKYNISYNGCINNATYLSTYNISYNGCINNDSYLSTYNISYLSTYNISYEGSINNATYLSTYNISYNGLISNSTYLSTYNISYDGCLNNASYLSTYNNSYIALNSSSSITTGKLSCKNITQDGTDTDFCTDATSAGGMDYTNVVLTNISSTFSAGQNLTAGTGGWFKGLFNWVIESVSSRYLSFNSTTLSFNETALNDTINNSKINCLNIVGSPDTDFCTDSTGSSSSTDYTPGLAMNISRESAWYEPFLIQSSTETGEIGIMGWECNANSGTCGSVTQSIGNRPGILQLSTTATANRNVSLSMYAASYFLDTNSGNISMEFALNLSNPPNNTRNYTAYVGFTNYAAISSADSTNSIAFKTNQTLLNWTCVVRRNNVEGYNITDISINGAFKKLRLDIINNSGTYEARYYIDGVLKCTRVSDGSTFPYGSTYSFGPQFTLKSQGGAVATTMNMDYIYYYQRFAVAR